MRRCNRHAVKNRLDPLANKVSCWRFAAINKPYRAAFQRSAYFRRGEHHARVGVDSFGFAFGRLEIDPRNMHADEAPFSRSRRLTLPPHFRCSPSRGQGIATNSTPAPGGARLCSAYSSRRAVAAGLSYSPMRSRAAIAMSLCAYRVESRLWSRRGSNAGNVDGLAACRGCNFSSAARGASFARQQAQIARNVARQSRTLDERQDEAVASCPLGRPFERRVGGCLDNAIARRRSGLGAFHNGGLRAEPPSPGAGGRLPSRARVMSHQ